MRRRWVTPSTVFLVLSVVGITLGAILRWGADDPDAANLVWGLTTAIGIVPIAWEVLSGLLRRQPGVDLIALLAMGGALALEEYLAGAVIAFMLATGRALEDFADARAHRELSALLERAPRTAHRYQDGSLTSVPIGEVRPGDRLLVKHGEVVPVDGLLVSGIGVLDESALTGESRPVERSEGEQVRSGAVNAGAAFDLRAVASADREHLRRHRPAGRAGAEGEGAVRPPGRPVRADLHPGDARGSRGSRGRSAATRCARSRCSSSRRRARCSWPRRSRSWPGSRGPPSAASS